MSLSDWSDAPYWACWKAQDDDGSVYYYEHEPQIDEDWGMWFHVEGTRVSESDGPSYSLEWTESLEFQPQTLENGKFANSSLEKDV